MNEEVTDQAFQRAMDTCASEPVHIPGTVQPFGCLVGVEPDSGLIKYASENCGEIIGIAGTKLLGEDWGTAFGHEITHALNNAAARVGFSNRSVVVGQFTLNGVDIELSAFASGDVYVLQFEHVKDPGLGGADTLNTLTFLMNEIQRCTDTQDFFNQSTDLLRHLTGYDRVMVYKFDPHANGEVIAETKHRSLESFIGLRFPKWDIPVQAREIMAKLPLRFIQDTDQSEIKLHAANETLPPLDITLAECRGVSAIHVEYLRNMGVRSTMTLSINVEGALWGMISFHHRRPRSPALKLRELLTAFLEVFSTKLTALTKQSQLDLVRRTDSIKDSVLDDIEGEEELEASISKIGLVIEDVLHADGIALLIGSKTVCHGRIPEQAVMAQLFRETQNQLGAPLIVENLSLKYPTLKGALNGCAGVLASAIAHDRAFCIFRCETAQKTYWAGNPEKKIEQTSGNDRLVPRGSFSAYLQDVAGCSDAWTSDDVYFAERIWVLINSAERRALKSTLNRQQALMINELNHRVRNILALVRSVSRQARRHYGTLESYSASLESRIQALAAAHDIASGSSLPVIELKKLIEVETAPYQKSNRISVMGKDLFLRAEIAPIFSLVIHELATNAAKYGALSVLGGSVSVAVSEDEGGAMIRWREKGGPIVVRPNERGFGTTLIEQAVPHEMGGSADLRFIDTGIEADLFLPNHILDFEQEAQPRNVLDARTALKPPEVTKFDPNAFEGTIFVLEDNFVIAKDLKDQLEDLGIEDVEICSTLDDAFDNCEIDNTGFAILDVNLGPGKTSESFALHLLHNRVPFIFVTGYGEKANLASELRKVPRLTKPVATLELQDVMMRVITR